MSQLKQVPAEHTTHVRYWVVLISMLMALLLYLDRFCVGFAADYIREDIGLTHKEVNWMVSAFFWSYALAQVPSGWLSDRYGARLMLVIYILSWSFFTLMIGAAYSFVILLGTRLAMGLGQAGAYPTSANVLSKWVPFSGRGTASSIVALGGRFGGAVAPLLTGFLMIQLVPINDDGGDRFTVDDILDDVRLANRLAELAKSDAQVDLAGRHIWDALRQKMTPATYGVIQSRSDQSSQEKLGRTAIVDMVDSFNQLLGQSDLYDATSFESVNLSREGLKLLKQQGAGTFTSLGEQQRFNRLLLEATFPGELRKLYTRGWRPVFFIYGFAGVVVAALYWWIVRNHPGDHPRCSEAERNVIAGGRPAGATRSEGRADKIPWMHLIKSRSMWCDSLMQTGGNVGWFLVVSSVLPRYLIEIHQVPHLPRAMMLSVPMAVGMLGMFTGGWFTDFLVPRIGLRWGRRLPMFATKISAAGACGCCLWFNNLSPDSMLHSPWAITICLAVVAFSTDFGNPAGWAFKQDVGGRYVGCVLGWGNMWGNLGASISEPIYGWVLGETPGLQDWNQIFLVCLSAFVISGICALGIDATIPIIPSEEDALLAAN